VNNALYEYIVALLTKKFGVSPEIVRPDLTFGELELDSLTRSEFLLMLEQELNVRVNDSDADLTFSLSDITKMLQSKGAAA
jgi:acyl carrier protein